MIYLSKGIVQKNSTEQQLTILRCGQEFRLTGTEAALWLNGRYGFRDSQGGMEKRPLEHLKRMGLVECEPENTAAGRYRVMTRCILCPTAAPKLEGRVFGMEKEILFWMRNAGLRLTVAELIYLTEHQVRPTPELLYLENRQALVETIYTRDTIADNLLEHQMEAVGCRDAVVLALEKLLRKKKILVL